MEIYPGFAVSFTKLAIDVFFKRIIMLSVLRIRNK